MSRCQITDETCKLHVGKLQAASKVVCVMKDDGNGAATIFN